MHYSLKHILLFN